MACSRNGRCTEGVGWLPVRAVDGRLRARSFYLEANRETVNPSDYDAWYDSEHGRWIGETEYRLLQNKLAPRTGERVLDVGCGTGWFTRRLAHDSSVPVTGIDLNADCLRFATLRNAASSYVQADARRLPFADNAFDCVCSITALCFIDNWSLALGEIVRVTRKRFAIGVLNRHSVLWLEKGRRGGTGAYRGAHWHTAAELRRALETLPVNRIELTSAVFLPGGSKVARWFEQTVPIRFLHGAFLVVAGEKRGNADSPG